MSRDVIRIGVLFSCSGSYAAVGRAMRAGAELAVAEINGDATWPVRFEPVAIDPGGATEAYVAGVQRLLAEDRLAHVFGCYTSSSRKEVLPLFEKHDALLWYPSHYEGFETSDNVVYTGAAPNQHILPLARYLLTHHGKRGWFVGSNYVWAWENNRILREALTAVGGAVIGERYFALGDTELQPLVDQILRRPTRLRVHDLDRRIRFRLPAAAARARQAARASTKPGSCPWRAAVSRRPSCRSSAPRPTAISRPRSTSPPSPRTRTRGSPTPGLAASGRSGRPAPMPRRPTSRCTSSRAAAEVAGATDAPTIRDAARGLSFAAPQGRVTVDPENLHCWMRPRIGRSTAAGTFDLVFEEAGPLRPDPYLVWSDPLRRAAPSVGTRPRVVP